MNVDAAWWVGAGAQYFSKHQGLSKKPFGAELVWVSKNEFQLHKDKRTQTKYKITGSLNPKASCSCIFTAKTWKYHNFKNNVYKLNNHLFEKP